MSDPVRYRLLGCLGEGGFGVVYRARLEGPDGFVKDVAIKLLRDPNAPDRVIARFRDEARILGLVRDRAIVSVDPPVQLDGHWALVMAFVDGVSCRQLIEQGPIPARPALELCAEVARALDVAHHQPGPDGTPLALLHRDLKPANLQLTPTGQVKVLDFGIGRAQFAGREAATTRHLAGTPGYIAPERLTGIEGPEGDVFCLGVVLHELITGLRPADTSANPTFEVDSSQPVDVAHAALDLARELRARNPTDRPTARAVEERCLALAASLDGPTLRTWAADHVPAEPPTRPDPRVGSVLTAASTLQAQGPATAATAAPSSPWILPAALVLAAVAAMASWELAPEGPAPLAQALEQPFADFVIEPDVARSERSELRAPDRWDRDLYDATVDHVERLLADGAIVGRLDQQWAVYRDVVAAIRATDLPEVLAGIPWVESSYKPELQSSHCAKGLWQLMPESAVRARELHGVELVVRDCAIGADQPFTPTALAPPLDPPYRGPDGCRIPARGGCAIDERTHPTKATAATLALLSDAWTDRDLARSGALVQITVASHFFGHDDGGWGAPRPTNLAPAFAAWAPTVDDADHPRFLTAANTDLAPNTADLVARSLAAHFVALCYYAENYPEEPVFRGWAKYRDGYCRSIDLPTRAEVARPIPQEDGG